MSVLSRHLIPLLLGILVLVICVTPPTLLAWHYAGVVLLPVRLAEPLQPVQPLAVADLNRDGNPERIDLADGQLFIYAQSDSATLAWQSPPDWQVKQALVTDLNHDTFPELALLVWRPFQPWPVDSYLPHGGRIADHQNRRGLSCHLVLIGWLSSGFGELWAGSALARPLRSLVAADLDGDGQQELSVLESRYNDPAFLPARSLAIWNWNGFGFDLQARTEGRFKHLQAVRSRDGNVYLITQ